MREARYGGDKALDEVVADDIANFHLEQMDDGRWWIGLTHTDGTETHISLFTKRSKISGLCEFGV